MNDEKKLAYKEQAIDLYNIFIFIKGAKCRPQVLNMK